MTTLGSGVDGSVRRIETAYDGQGNAYLVTSYDAASGGSIVNQVQRAFNGLGQLITEWQAHGGAVNTSTSPKVQYAWSEMPSGADHSRLTSITYTDGYVLTYNYASGLDSSISRLSSLSDTTGSLEAYSYLGLSTVVVRAHSQTGVDLTYLKRSGESVGDAGDQYIGLDRFGRVVDQRWVVASSGTATDRFQYTYDAAGNRTARVNVVNSAFNESYTYDGLDQLTGFTRGSHTQAFDYDAVGNFDSVTTNGGTAQTRSANAQNEITGISGATTPTYDASGNMTGDETGRQFVYDAWNRLVAVKNSGGTTLETFAYDGLNRRVSQTASGTTTDLYYSADWQVLTEKVGSATTKRYVWSPVYVDALILRDRDTNADGTLDERLWVQQDANWNVTALLDGSGAVVERYAYDPYGVRIVYDASYTVRSGGSSYDFQHGFQGRPYDAISATYNFRNREVSATLGRPIQVDMLRFGAGDVNFYRWEGNHPTNSVDPSGLDEVSFTSWVSNYAIPSLLNQPTRPVAAAPGNQSSNWNFQGALEDAATWLAIAGEGIAVGMLDTQIPGGKSVPQEAATNPIFAPARLIGNALGITFGVGEICLGTGGTILGIGLAAPTGGGTLGISAVGDILVVHGIYTTGFGIFAFHNNITNLPGGGGDGGKKTDPDLGLDDTVIIPKPPGGGGGGPGVPGNPMPPRPPGDGWFRRDGPPGIKGWWRQTGPNRWEIWPD